MNRRPTAGSIFASSFSGALGVTMLMGLTDAALFARSEGLPGDWFYTTAVNCYIILGVGFGLILGLLASLLWMVVRRGGRAIWSLGVWAAAVMVAFLPLPIHAIYHSNAGPFGFVRVLPAGLVAVGAVLLALLIAWYLRDRHRLIGALIRLGWLGAAAALLIAIGHGTWISVRETVRWTPTKDVDLPNIAVIIIDNLRADHVGCYGYDRPTSPVIDAIAKEGVLFRRAHSTSNYTAPPHATLLTARYPSEHGVGRARTLAPWNSTLPEFLGELGYATVGVVSNPQLSHVFGFNKGFDVYDDSVGDTRTAIMWFCRTPGFAVFFPNRKQHFAFRTELRRRFNFPEPPAAHLTNRLVLDYLDDVAGRPWFLFANYVDPHFPWTPPRRFKGAFEMKEESYLNSSEESELIQRFAAVLSDREHLLPDTFTERELEFCLAKYDREIEYLDMELGKLFDFLREKGELDETLIFITSDHGEHFGEEGLLYHKNSLLSELVDVPLIVRYPPLVHGPRIVEDVVSLVDVPTTILELARVAAPFFVPSGQSLMPFLTDDLPTDPRAVAISEWEDRRVLIRGDLRAYFDGDSLVAVEQNGGPGPDHQLVPADQIAPELARELFTLLERWRVQHGTQGGESVGDVELSDELRSRLRALGYLD